MRGPGLDGREGILVGLDGQARPGRVIMLLIGRLRLKRAHVGVHIAPVPETVSPGPRGITGRVGQNLARPVTGGLPGPGGGGGHGGHGGVSSGGREAGRSARPTEAQHRLRAGRLGRVTPGG